MSKNYDLQNLITVARKKDGKVKLFFILKKDNMTITIVCLPEETSNV